MNKEWQKELARSFVSCDNESQLLPSLLSHPRFSAIETEPPGRHVEVAHVSHWAIVGDDLQNSGSLVDNLGDGQGEDGPTGQGRWLGLAGRRASLWRTMPCRSK